MKDLKLQGYLPLLVPNQQQHDKTRKSLLFNRKHSNQYNLPIVTGALGQIGQHLNSSDKPDKSLDLFNTKDASVYNLAIEDLDTTLITPIISLTDFQTIMPNPQHREFQDQSAKLINTSRRMKIRQAKSDLNMYQRPMENSSNIHEDINLTNQIGLQSSFEVVEQYFRQIQRMQAQLSFASIGDQLSQNTSKKIVLPHQSNLPQLNKKVFTIDPNVKINRVGSSKLQVNNSVDPKNSLFNQHGSKLLQMIRLDESPKIPVIKQPDQVQQILEPTPPKIFVVNKPIKGLFHYADKKTLEINISKPLSRGLGAVNVGSQAWTIAKSKQSAINNYSESLRIQNLQNQLKSIRIAENPKFYSVNDKIKAFWNDVQKPKMPTLSPVSRSEFVSPSKSQLRKQQISTLASKCEMLKNQVFEMKYEMYNAFD